MPWIKYENLVVITKGIRDRQENLQLRSFIVRLPSTAVLNFDDGGKSEQSQ